MWEEISRLTTITSLAVAHSFSQLLFRCSVTQQCNNPVYTGAQHTREALSGVVRDLRGCSPLLACDGAMLGLVV